MQIKAAGVDQLACQQHGRFREIRNPHLPAIYVLFACYNQLVGPTYSLAIDVAMLHEPMPEELNLR
jgi:hypothetical protein